MGTRVLRGRRPRVFSRPRARCPCGCAGAEVQRAGGWPVGLRLGGQPLVPQLTWTRQIGRLL